MSDDEGAEIGVPLIEDISDDLQSRKQHASGNKKRKLESEGEKKSAKRKKSRKPADVDDDALDSGLGVNRAIGLMDSGLMADHIGQRTRRFRPELSLVETDDIRVPEKCIVDTTSWGKERIADLLPDFLEQFAAPKRSSKKGRKLSDAPQEKGHPHTLVIAGAGLRAADLTRALRRFQTKEALVAKLFAKHIKLNEAIESTKKTRMNIGVGTPQRIIDLLDKGALSSTQLERIVIDASHIDQKKRGILDMKETQVPLIQLLTRKELKERYDDGRSKVELLFF